MAPRLVWRGVIRATPPRGLLAKPRASLSSCDLVHFGVTLFDRSQRARSRSVMPTGPLAGPLAPRRRRAPLWWIVLLSSVLCPHASVAQQTGSETLQRPPSHVQESRLLAGRQTYPLMQYAGINVLIGAVSAAVRTPQAAERGWRARAQAAFWGGVGGLVMTGGHRLLGDTAVLPLMGAYTAALGSSISHNAGLGRHPLAEVILPVSPLWISVETGLGHDGGPRLTAAVSLPQLVSLGEWAIHPGVEGRVDWGLSARAGSLIMRSRSPVLFADSSWAAACLRSGWSATACPPDVSLRPNGRFRLGTTIVGQDVPGGSRRATEWTLRHELVHQSQHVRDWAVVSGPLLHRIHPSHTIAVADRPDGVRRPWVGVVWFESPGLLAGVDRLLGPRGGGRGATDRWYEREAEGAIGADGCGWNLWRCE